jgi:hypothetical protein
VKVVQELKSAASTFSGAWGFGAFSAASALRFAKLIAYFVNSAHIQELREQRIRGIE